MKKFPKLSVKRTTAGLKTGIPKPKGRIKKAASDTPSFKPRFKTKVK